MAQMGLSSGQQRRLLLVLSSALVAALGWTLARPAWDELSGLKSQLDGLTASLPPASPGPVPLIALIQRMRRVAQLLTTEGERFPVSENVSTLLVDLQGIKSTGTDITRFYPTKLQPVALPGVATRDLAVSRQDVLIDADGSFFALREFLQRLELFKDPVRISSISLGAAPTLAAAKGRPAPLRLTMEVDLSAFLIDEPLGNPEAAERALEDLVGRLEQQVRAVRPAIGPATAPPPAQVPVPPSVRGAPARSPAVRRPPFADWQTLGILAVKGRTPAAILSIDGQQTAVARGDTLEGGWLVDRIDATGVLLRRGLLTRRLPLAASGSPVENGTSTAPSRP